MAKVGARAINAAENIPSLSVLLINQHYAPSDAPTAQLLADVGAALANDGHQVAAISSRRGYRTARIRYPKRNVINGVTVRRVPGTAFNQSRRRGRVANYFAFFATSSLRMLTTRKPDVVVCLSSPPLLGSIVQTIASARGIRVVYWIMDLHPDLLFKLDQMRATSLAGRFLRAVSLLPLRNADTVVVLGDDMALRVEANSNGSTRIVPSWADGDWIQPSSTVGHALRKEWGWDGRFVVAYSGNLGLVHEFETIIEAAARLDSDDRYLFCFIGNGARTDEAKAEVRRRNLRNVQFRDFVPEEQLPDSLTAPDVHLVSLRGDLAGLSVPSKTYGILAAGKPVAFVGPSESDIAALVRNHACGVHVDNGDAEGLAAAIRAYGENSETLTSHETAARQTFDDGYSRPRGLAAMVSIIAR